MDSTGLARVGARYYLASLGRFLSPDPLLDPNDPQQVHGYGYANNNPTTLSDPSGLGPVDINGNQISPDEPGGYTGPVNTGAGAGSSSGAGSSGGSTSNTSGGASGSRDLVGHSAGGLLVAAIVAFERVAVGFSALHLTSAIDIAMSRHNADPRDVRRRKIEVNMRSGNGLKWAGRFLGAIGTAVTFHDELTRETDAEVSTEERVADASIITGAGGLGGLAVVAAGGGAAACAVSVVCGVSVVAVGGIFSVAAAYGMHRNDGWLTGGHEGESLMAPGPLIPGPSYDTYFDPYTGGGI